MFQNYCKIAWRNIRKYPFYSLVNVIGLFTGIAFSFLIGVYIWGELQVNRKLRNEDRQFILTTQSKDKNLGYECASFGPLAKRLKENYPYLVAGYYRFDGITSVVSKGEKHLRENIQLGDSTLLQQFGFELLHGNSGNALNSPSSVILSKAIALKYFGKTDVVGETLNIQSFTGQKKDFAVTGVLNDIPDNSVTHLVGEYSNDIFIGTRAISFFGRQDFDAWTNIYIGSYVQLQAGVRAKDLEKPIQHLLSQNTDTFIQQNIKVVPVALNEYYLQKDNRLVYRMLYSLCVTGIFILLMAIINFINIAITRSSARMKEIGIRKVLGCLRKELILQFLTESVILVLIATLLAMTFYPFLRPLFSQLVGKEIAPLSLFPVYFIFIPITAVLFVGLLAGFYPAFVLSSLKSVDAFKGRLNSIKENISLRRSLDGFQFSIALVVLIAATIVHHQVSYFFSKNLGYNKEFIVSSMVPRDWSKSGVQKMEVIRNEFSAMPQILQATLSYEIPDGNNGGASPVYKSGSDSTTAIPMQILVADENYLSTFQIPLNAGYFFDAKGLDSGNVVMNKTAVEILGYKNVDQAVGQKLKIPGDPTIYTIKGVTGDFHFGSMQQIIPPILFFNVNFATQFRYLSFKIRSGNVPASIDAIQKKWSALLPGSSFEYIFMDNALKKLYATEFQIKKAAYLATVLSFIITILGVVGLVTLNVQKRVKEIGIRKVLGASIQNIMGLFLKEFLAIILVSGFIACPLALIISKNWLNNYAYRIILTPEPFLLAIAALVLLTVLIIGLQTLNAAKTNPTKSLKTE